MLEEEKGEGKWHVAIEDQPHLTHLIFEMIGPLNKGTAACFDTTKAFNKISHSVLTAKLVEYSLKKLTVKWVENLPDQQSPRAVLSSPKSIWLERAMLPRSCCHGQYCLMSSLAAWARGWDVL